MNKKVLLLSILPIISYSSLKCDLSTKKNCNYTEKIATLKMQNNNIYKAYLLADDNNIIIQDNIDESLPLASLTKMMTAVIVMDNIKDLNEKIIISEKASKIPYGVRVKCMEEYSVLELLKIMLIKSSNSAAQALSEYISDDFINLMNKKAQELGLTKTKYFTPYGLPPKYTNTGMDIGSARDMYKLSKYIIKNYPLLKEIVRTKTEVVHGHNLKSTNNLLLSMENVKGIKTGFHNQSKYNISVYYYENNLELFEIILGTQNTLQREKLTKAVLEDLKGIK